MFSLSTTGSDFQVVHSSAGAPTDGSYAYGGLTQIGSTLYGVTIAGGSADDGTVFAMKLDGSDYRILHSFTGGATDGENPTANLVLVGSTLYGTTTEGGTANDGTLFSLQLDGTNFQVVHSFSSAADNAGVPRGDLALSGSVLYGTTENGGFNGHGAVYSFVVPEPSAFVLGTLALPALWMHARRSSSRGRARPRQ